MNNNIQQKAKDYYLPSYVSDNFEKIQSFCNLYWSDKYSCIEIARCIL